MIAIDILISRTVTLQKHRFSLSVDAFACADFFTPFFPLSRPQKFSASAADVSLIMRRENQWEKIYIYNDEFSERAAWTPEQKNYNLEERI